MEPGIVSRDSFHVLGIASRVVRGTEAPETFRKIWENFESHLQRIEPRSTDHSYYGISFTGPGVKTYDYFAGMAVRNVDPIPEGLEIREVPEGKYAVFDCDTRDIGKTYRYIFEQWLPASSYRIRTNAPSFEQYPPRDSGSTAVRLHIAIEVRTKG